MVCPGSTFERKMPMSVDLQRASMWKRISAWLFDSILLISVVVLAAYALSSILGYDKYDAKLDSVYSRYEQQYDIDFGQREAPEDATQEEKEAYKERYEQADAALRVDEEAVQAYGMITNLMLLIPTIGLLLSMLLMEFFIPLILKNGQTLGKKIFGVGVVRIDCVQITGVQLFVRTILSKYTVGMMIPIYMLLLLVLGVMGPIGVILALGLLLAQLLCPLFNRDRRGLHDFLSGTVTVDLASQRVFADAKERIEYIKKVHAENAAKQDY